MTVYMITSLLKDQFATTSFYRQQKSFPRVCPCSQQSSSILFPHSGHDLHVQYVISVLYDQFPGAVLSSAMARCDVSQDSQKTSASHIILRFSCILRTDLSPVMEDFPKYYHMHIYKVG